MSSPDFKFIAELCQNHNGDKNLVFKMLDAAIEAGASRVKLQHIFVENLTFRPEFEEGGVNPTNGQTYIKRPFQPEYERLAGLELSLDVCREFVKRCEAQGVIPMTTCFCTEHADILADIGFREIKVASYDCASPNLLEALKGNYQHIYVSTGATFDREVEQAATILQDDFSMLHCVTRYPTPIEHLNLKRISWLKKFTDKVGYSDHSKTEEVGIFPACAAIFAGASIVERHFTVLEAAETRDGPVSVTSDQVADIIAFAHMSRDDQKARLAELGFDVDLAMGADAFSMSDEEFQNRLYYRGRFASQVAENGIKRHVYNWEPL